MQDPSALQGKNSERRLHSIQRSHADRKLWFRGNPGDGVHPGLGAPSILFFVANVGIYHHEQTCVHLLRAYGVVGQTADLVTEIVRPGARRGFGFVEISMCNYAAQGRHPRPSRQPYSRTGRSPVPGAKAKNPVAAASGFSCNDPGGTPSALAN